ncbi:MAG: hypothetical protein MSIBF_04090 [Candidatus Altiarchaeales archaeon IMC4]|nr:MAG: hypothetical protein MSIBF_04090 [Candidatus Altiarchaeales archaeon IMC4]
MNGKMRFVDTSVIVYAYDFSENAKRAKCKALIEAGFKGEAELAVSNQILAELFVVLTKKIEKPVSVENAKIIVNGIIESDNWVKVNYDSDTVGKAVMLAKRIKNAHFWDALIAETMLENNIYEIYTENVKDFKEFPGIKAINPISSPKAC